MVTPIFYFVLGASDWERTTRDIQDLSAYDTTGPTYICSDNSPIPSATFNCTETKSGGIGTPPWTTYVATLRNATTFTISVPYGGVSGQAGKVYVRHVLHHLFAQYDIVIVNGEPTVQNYVFPAIENWVHPGGAYSGGDITRTLRDFDNLEYMHHFYTQGIDY